MYISVLYCVLYDSDLEHFCGFYTIQNKLLLLLLHGHQVAIFCNGWPRLSALADSYKDMYRVIFDF